MKVTSAVPIAAVPIAVAGATAAAAVYVRLNDPAEGSAWFPPCIFHATTGLWCPGCGLTRAAHAALRGDIAAALSANLLAPAFALALAGAWWMWWARTRGRPAPAWTTRTPRWTGVATIVVLVVFGVLRNIPAAPFDALAP